MTPKTLSRRLEELGFARVEDETGSLIWERRTRTGTESVHFRNSMGGAYVLYLGHNCRPYASKGITGEKVFEYVDRNEKAATLATAWEWFSTTGLRFLADPDQRPLQEWQTQERILVRRNGEGIEIPRERRLP